MLANDYSGNYKRVKHYITPINFFFIIEQDKNGVISFQFVKSKFNVADIF